jgi:predicted ArsR family transcriptional regulator
MSPETFSAAVAAVTSAFGDPTRRDIFLFVREEPEGATAADVADRFALHPNVARHHLDKLAAGGYLVVAVERAGRGGAGRPSKHYRASADHPALDLPPHKDELLLTLVSRLLPLIPAAEAATVAESVGEEYGRALAQQMSPGEGQRSLRAAMQAVADALTAHGFAASTEARGPSMAVVANACPFGDAALEHPVICALDRGMVKGMLAGLYGDCMAATEACRPQGDEVCVTLV